MAKRRNDFLAKNERRKRALERLQNKGTRIYPVNSFGWVMDQYQISKLKERIK